MRHLASTMRAVAPSAAAGPLRAWPITMPVALLLVLGALAALPRNAGAQDSPAPADSAIADTTATPAAAPADTTTAPRTFEELRERWRREGVAPPDTGSWITPEAARDSLDTFWRGIDEGWLDPLPDALRDLDLERSAVDSLTRVGDHAVLRLRTGGFWKLDWQPIGRLAFNRAEGMRPGASVRARMMGLHRPELTLGGGYGIASERFVYDGRLRAPLLIARPTDPDGLPSGPSWPWLTLELEGGRTTRMFGGDLRRIRGLTALAYGADPNHYYTRKGGSAVLRVSPRRWLDLRLGVFRADHDPLARATTWTLIPERRDDVPPNLHIEGLHTRGMLAGTRLRWRRWTARATVAWHRIDGGGFLDLQPGAPGGSDELDLRRLELGLDGRVIDGRGNEYVLRGRWISSDRQAPLQWKGWLGDYGTLRGFAAGALVGDQAGWVTLDARWDLDLFRALRVPLLGKLGLQPLSFVEYGRAIALDGPLPAAGEDGWRADAGIGLGKLLGVPGGYGNLRLYASRPVFHGSEHEDWRFVLAFEN